jgi:NADH-quinone oxidoreductase subunit E
MGKTKPNFVGLKMTVEQAALLSSLQQNLRLPTKTGVLLKGLELLAKLHPLGFTPTWMGSPEGSGVGPQIVASAELARIESEARLYNSIVQQTRDRTKEVMRQMIQELAKTDEIIDKYRGDKSALIQILLRIQRENNWLPEDALLWVSKRLDVPLSQIYHVATFYKAFSLVPRGRHVIHVCLGTACQVRGAPRLLDRVTERLKIRPGETSRDMRFSLDTVNCLGCCALGPVMVVDGRYYGRPTVKEIEQIIQAAETEP